MQKEKKYKSYSGGLKEQTLGIVILSFSFNFYLIYITSNLFIISVSFSIGILLIVFSIYRMRNKTCTIEFNEQNVLLNFKYLKEEIILKYSDISELKYIESVGAYNSFSSVNKIQILYDFNGKNNSINFQSLDDENFIEFVKWIKTKNKQIQITTSSSDSLMNEKLQEEFGWKYRK